MGRGIKLSSGAISNINYETFHGSGDSTVFGEDFYLVGTGLSSLASANHENVYVSETNKKQAVYLFNDYSQYPTWCTDSTLSTGITAISESETEDVDLYAKWKQYLYQKDLNYNLLDYTFYNVTLSSGDSIFKWRVG